MVAMWMVQAAVDEIVGVIAMRNRFMAASRAVAMRRIMTAAAMFRAAAVRVGGTDFDDVLLEVPVIWVLQLPGIQVIQVPFVANRKMATAGTMHVRMSGVRSAGCHVCLQLAAGYVSDSRAWSDGYHANR